MIIGNALWVSGGGKLYLIKGLNQCTSETGGWSGLAIWRTSGDRNDSSNGILSPTVDSSGTSVPYIILTRSETATSGGGYSKRGAYVTASAVDLTNYNRLTLKYDVVAWGTTSQYRYGILNLVTRTSQPMSSTSSASGAYNQITDKNAIEIRYGNGAYQPSSGSAVIDASTKLTDQELTLDITSELASYVTIGLNQQSGGTAFQIAIKSLYAWNE